MKNQRTRRRKLRFSSTKDAAPVATERNPAKRRKRSPKSGPRAASGLPSATWSLVQELFVAAKSLGDITRVVLRLLKEHEELQGAAVFPIFVPASEIYMLKVPRKRRIYDVLHVLEGIGVIKRVRWNDSRKTKGGSFLYYGKAAAVQRLAEIKRESAQAITHFRQSRPSKANTVEEDSVLVEGFEHQAVLQKWPCLVTTTTCFLSLLFQQHYQVAVALPELSSRLVEAKKFMGALVPTSPSLEATFNDVHRRLYDVVSVLAACNLMHTSVTSDMSLETTFEAVDKNQQRKHVRFNYDVFTDPKALFGADGVATSWSNCGPYESAHGSSRAGEFISPPPATNSEDRHIPHSLTRCQSLHPNYFFFITSPMFIPAASSLIEEPRTDLGAAKDIASLSKTPSLSQPQAESAPQVHELFSPFGKMLPGKNEWCDESLKQLELYDALPSEDKIDWELNKQFKDSYRGLWGCQYSPIAAIDDPIKISPHHCLVDRVEVEAGGLKCHEMLPDDKTTAVARFFC